MPRIRIAAAAAAVALIALAGTASAARVPNGNFESGTLAKWKQTNTTAHSWSLYEIGDRGVGPFSPDLPEPRGTYSPTSLQSDPGAGALYRRIALPDSAKKLILRHYYVSEFTPGGSFGNFFFGGAFEVAGPSDTQYFSLDLIRKRADPLTARPRQILRPIFAPDIDQLPVPPRAATSPTSSGGWVKRAVNVRRWAGKKVQLRLAVVVEIERIATGIDDLKVKTKRRRR